MTCSSAYYSVVEKLLGSWILVDSFQEASAFQRSSNTRWNCVTLDERRGADAATVGTRTQCEVDDRNYDSPVRRLHH